MNRFVHYLPSLLLLNAVACTNSTVDKSDEAKAGIAAAEKAFAEMAAKKGIAAAFEYYADSNAVIKRGNDSLVKGKAAIRHFYSAPVFSNARVDWSPDFIEASAAGDLGYTWGSYTWITSDSSGQEKSTKGVFHTVWKKQADGNWKYVWD